MLIFISNCKQSREIFHGSNFPTGHPINNGASLDQYEPFFHPHHRPSAPPPRPLKPPAPTVLGRR